MGIRQSRRLHHSDQGSPYASDDYQDILTQFRMIGSMSRRGNCYDNAVMESWFSTVKHELGEHFESCGSVQSRLVCSVGVSPTGVTARRPVAWIAARKETEWSEAYRQSHHKGW